MGKEQTELQKIQTRLTEHEDSSSELEKQLEIYKQMNEEAKREYNEAEKQRKTQIAKFEKKAHSNWVSSNSISS